MTGGQTEYVRRHITVYVYPTFGVCARAFGGGGKERDERRVGTGRSCKDVITVRQMTTKSGASIIRDNGDRPGKRYDDEGSLPGDQGPRTS